MEDDDLEDMKIHFEGKKGEILLWCYDPSISRKRSRGDSDPGPSARKNSKSRGDGDPGPSSRKNSKSRGDSDAGPSAPKSSKSRSRFANAYEKKMTKVQEIFETLKEKHGDKFKPEQLNAWANMIQMQKHA